MPFHVFFSTYNNGAAARVAPEERKSHRLPPILLRRQLRHWRMSGDEHSQPRPGAGPAARWLDGVPLYAAGSEGFVQTGNPESGYQLGFLDPAQLTPQKLGKCIEDVKMIESAYQANRKNAERIGERYGEHTRLEACTKADLNRKACFEQLDRIPGGAELRMLCDLKKHPFDAASLRLLRAELCIAKGISPSEADQLPISEAVAILRSLYRAADTPATLSGERELSPLEKAARSKRRYAERDAEVVRLKQEDPRRTSGQIAKLVRQNPAWATMENGKPFSAGAAKAILQRARKPPQSP
jgi:hypothetical protein